MEVVFAPAFLRILKKFDPPVKEGVKAAVVAVTDYYETGQKTPGLGLTQLRGLFGRLVRVFVGESFMWLEKID